MYLSYWRIRAGAVVLASSSSSLAAKRGAMVYLAGQRLVDMRIEPSTGATAFTFDLGGALCVRRRKRVSTEALWYLHKPNGYVLSVNGDGAVVNKPAIESSSGSHDLSANGDVQAGS